MLTQRIHGTVLGKTTDIMLWNGRDVIIDRAFGYPAELKAQPFQPFKNNGLWEAKDARH